MNEILIDSNILIYALNKAAPKHLLAQGFLLHNPGALYIAQQNIMETFRILTHPKFPNQFTTEEAVNALSVIMGKVSVIQPTPLTHYLCLKLMSSHQLYGNRTFDSFLVATMLSNDIKTIATDNVRDFQIYTQLKILNPFDKRATLVHDRGEKEYLGHFRK